VLGVINKATGSGRIKYEISCFVIVLSVASS
jgi:hypothetical protein